MKILNHILSGVSVIDSSGSMDTPVREIQFDSRKVQPGDLFVAVVGTVSDGNDFVDQAIGNGAASVVCQTMPSDLNAEVTYLQVEDSSFALAQIASICMGVINNS